MDIDASCVCDKQMPISAGLADLGCRWGCRWGTLEAGFSNVYPFVVTSRIDSVLHEVKPPEEVWVSVSPLRTRDIGL